MFHEILLAYDGSRGAEKALDMALSLASESEAELWVLAVEEHLPRFAATVGEMEEEKAFANHYYQDRLSAAYLRALQLGIPFNSAIRVGHAAQTIIQYAKDGNFDLVVLGCGQLF